MEKKHSTKAATEGELRLVASIEGRSRQILRLLAPKLGISVSSACRTLQGLKRRRVTREVWAVRRDLASGSHECVALIRVHTSDAAQLGAFERTVVEDAAVWTADRVTGEFDYRIHSFHYEERAAHAWFRLLMSRQAVAAGRMMFTRTVLDRPHYAAAIVGSSGAG